MEGDLVCLGCCGEDDVSQQSLLLGQPSQKALGYDRGTIEWRLVEMVELNRFSQRWGR